MKRKPLTALVVAAISTGFVVPTVAAGAAPIATPPANCKASFDPYAYTSSALASCGYQVYPASSVQALPGGGTATVYDENGTTVTDLVPPVGFDPLTATATQLDEYGLPPRPTDPTALTTWTAEMGSWTGVVPAEPFDVADPFMRFATHSPQFAGYFITATPGFFNHAEAWYTEPTVYPSPKCVVTTEATWAGIGGNGPLDPLGQDGTAYGEGLVGIANHQAWEEVVPGTGPHPFNLSGHSGYQFDASTRAISTGYRFFVYDYYTKTSKTVDVSTNAYSGDSAEAVVEHPGLLSGLSNFGTMSFNQTEANGNYFSNYTKSRLEVWMYDPFGTLMASTSDIGANGSFTATQHSCN